MCVVSAISDDYSKRFPEKYPNHPWDSTPGWNPNIFPSNPEPWLPTIDKLPGISAQIKPTVTKEEFDKLKSEFDQLKAEMEEVKRVLLVAKKYDEDNSELHCEKDEKVELLKKIAKYVGVDLTEIFEILDK